MTDNIRALVPQQQQFDNQQLEIIRKTVAIGLSPDQFLLFIEVCKHYRLNPMARQIYAYPGQGGRMIVQTSIDGFRLMAERTGLYGGQIGPQWCGEDGVWVDVWLKKEPPAAARVGIIRRDFDQPIWGVARYSSYAGTTPIWVKAADVMLAKCFSEDTEVLTDQGFQKFSEVSGRVLQVTDQGLEPTDSHPFVQDYDGVMVTLDSDDLNFSVTPNHDMVTTEGKIEARDMYDQARARPKFWIPRLVTTDKPGLPVSNEQIQIAAAFLADGSKVSSSSFRIEVSREHKISLLRSVGMYRYEGTQKSAGFVAHTAVRDIVSTSDKARFVYDFSLIDWLCSPDKSIKVECILQMSQDQARLFVDTLLQLDGHTQKATGVRRFYTSRIEHLQAFELACAVAGYSVNKAVERTSDISSRVNYMVTVSHRDAIPVMRWGRFYRYEKPHISKREQTSLKLTRNVSGKVWCVTVPSGVIVVRRNGFSMLCGNCAESLGFRKAFPAEMSGIYTHEEMDQAQNEMRMPTYSIREEPAEGMVTTAQLASIRKLCGMLGRPMRLGEDKQTVGEAIKRIQELQTEVDAQPVPTLSELKARSEALYPGKWDGIKEKALGTSVEDEDITPEKALKLHRALAHWEAVQQAEKAAQEQSSNEQQEAQSA